MDLDPACRPPTPRETAGRVPAVDGLAGALAADLEAGFERLVRSETDRLYSIAYRLLGDGHEAEEVTQDAFVRAYRSLASYEPARIESLALRPWLTAIVVNLARNRRRRAAARRRGGRAGGGGAAAVDGERGSPHPRALSRPPRRVAESVELADDDPATAPGEVALRREAVATWAALLAGLPPRYRLPVVLRYVGGLSTPEVAAALGRPEGTVRAQLHRGLARLRAAYLAASDASTGDVRPPDPAASPEEEAR